MWVYRGSLCPCGGVLRILRSIQSVLDPCWLLLPGRVTIGCSRSIWPFGRNGTIAPVAKPSLMLSLCSNIEALLSCHCLLEDDCLRYRGALPTMNRQMRLRTWVHVCLIHYLDSILLVRTCQLWFRHVQSPAASSGSCSVNEPWFYALELYIRAWVFWKCLVRTRVELGKETVLPNAFSRCLLLLSPRLSDWCGQGFRASRCSAWSFLDLLWQAHIEVNTGECFKAVHHCSGM